MVEVKWVYVCECRMSGHRAQALGASSGIQIHFLSNAFLSRMCPSDFQLFSSSNPFCVYAGERRSSGVFFFCTFFCIILHLPLTCFRMSVRQEVNVLRFDADSRSERLNKSNITRKAFWLAATEPAAHASRSKNNMRPQINPFRGPTKRRMSKPMFIMLYAVLPQCTHTHA